MFEGSDFLEIKHMNSPTYGKVDLEQIIKIIKNIVDSEPQYKYNLFVGTDSQNFDSTKMVMVVALHKVGAGGIFFYKTFYVPKVKSIRKKLTIETQASLGLADKLIELFEKEFDKTGFDYTKINFGIHVDIGTNGKTNVLIPEITAWVKACGYECSIKPDSFTASSIANKYSK